MDSRLRATLWILTLVTAVYISQQYRVAQQARASAHTEHTSISATPKPAIPETPKPAYQVRDIGGRMMRINEITGETHYWDTEGGGWVKIQDTNLVTAVSKEERDKREAIITSWYNSLADKTQFSYEEFAAPWRDTPSWQLQESFTKMDQQAKDIILHMWYDRLKQDDPTADFYDAFVSNKNYLTTTALREDFYKWVKEREKKEEIIKEWYQLTDEEYKQSMPYETFHSNLLREHVVNLSLGLDKVKREKSGQATSTSDQTSRELFCPICGEHYRGGVVKCPKDDAELKPVLDPSA